MRWIHSFFLLYLFSTLINSVIFGKGIEPIQEVFEPVGNFDPAIYGKVAVVQWNQPESTPIGVTIEQAEIFMQRNREILASYITEAASKGSRLVLTPEFGVVGYPDIPELPSEEDNFQNREQIAPYVEPVGGATTQYFSALAKKLGVTLHVGFAEVEPMTQEYFNTVIVMGPKGELIARYRKIHLFELEDKFLTPGTEPVTYQGDFGKVGISICSDIYSSDPMEEYRDLKVNVIALSTSWAEFNSGMAAFEYAATWVNAFVLAANQTYFPDSGVINPDGTTQSHIRQSVGVAYGYLPYR